MRCIRPRTLTYRDLMGRTIPYSCPCGKCIACLSNQHDSWAIRMLETSKCYSEFVYDTLTFSNDNIPSVDMFDDDLPALSDESVRLLRYYTHYDKETGERYYRLPKVERVVIRDWIRRGRELYYYDHKERLRMKYFVCMEYGPKTSRPHFHLIFWGVSKSDYIKYFKKPWRRQYGFTCTRYITGSLKDRQCISRYISKYVSKGVFESPFVQDGICPPVFRSISHGIGEEYLSKPVFSPFRGFFAEVLKDITCDMSKLSGERGRYDRIRTAINNDLHESILKYIPSDSLRFLQVYYDDMGLPHSLPRYYKSKLLNLHKPNLLSYAIQSYLLLLSRARESAQDVEYLRSVSGLPYTDVSDYVSDLGSELVDKMLCEYHLGQRNAAYIAASDKFKRLKNHYQRSMNLSFS